MNSTVSGPENPRRPARGTPRTPPSWDDRVPESETYAAELLLDEDDVPELDEFELDDFESEEDDFDSDDEVDVDGFEDDDAGELLDEEPRLSLR